MESLLVICLLPQALILFNLFLNSISVAVFFLFFMGNYKDSSSLPLKSRFVLTGTPHALRLVSFPEGFCSMAYKKY